MHQHARLAQLVDHVRGHIAHADRTACREHQRIRSIEQMARGFIQRLEVVADDAARLRHAARAFHNAADRVGVDIAHLAGLRLVVRIDHFVAGRQNADARPLRHGDLRDAQRHQAAQILRA